MFAGRIQRSAAVAGRSSPSERGCRMLGERGAVGAVTLRPAGETEREGQQSELGRDVCCGDVDPRATSASLIAATSPTLFSASRSCSSLLPVMAALMRRLGLPVQSVPDETFGPFGPIFAMDQPASSAHTRAALGWHPTHPSLLDDLELLEP